MIITRLVASPNIKDKINVHVDGKYFCAIYPEDIVKYDLRIGKELTEKEEKELKDSADFARWYDFAINYISFRPRSIQEVRQHFSQKQFKEKIEISCAEKVIEKLIEKKFLSDEDFSLWFVEQRRAFRQKSAAAIRQELQKKGVDKKIIDKVFESGDQNEEEMALQLALKKCSRIHEIGKKEKRDKIYRFLAGKGFSYEVIKTVVEKIGLSGYDR